MPAAIGGVIGVVAEMGLNAVATVVALADGTTSLYLSSGGGTIGAGAHRIVAVCALKLVGAAEQARSSMEVMTSCPLPRPKHVRFYVVSGDGVRSVEVLESELQKESHPLAPMYRLTHHVISAIRQIQPKSGTA